MNVFARILKVGEAKINQITDKLENPELMLNQAIVDQQKKIGQVKEKVRDVIAEERRTYRLLQQEQENQKEWENKAKKALQLNEEELATKALVRAEEYEVNYKQLLPTWEELRNQADQLKLEVKKLEDEFNQLKRNKEVLIAQSKAANVKKVIYDAKASIGNSKNTDLVERMKAKIEKQKYQAEASAEIALDLDGQDSLEKKFAKIDSVNASSSVQSKLDNLRKELESK